MEQLNQTLFFMINASASASWFTVAVARVLAEGTIWIVPVGLVVGWLRGTSAMRQALVGAVISGLLGLLINQVIGLVWYHPRPVEAGVGRILAGHALDSSFPSDHLTFMWAVALSLLMRGQLRRAGWVLAALGLPVAWARIYLGVHFPLDILGAAPVALVSAWLVLQADGWLCAPLLRQALPIYRALFAGLIARGWVMK